MWKRSTRQPRNVGDPVLNESILEDPPQRTTNLNSGDFSISARPAFGRKETADVLKGLPDLPLWVNQRIS